MPIRATYANELSIEDFKLEGPLSSKGVTIERVDTNYFKVVLGYVPEHPLHSITIPNHRLVLNLPRLHSEDVSN